jgi:hypothetical protein
MSEHGLRTVDSGGRTWRSCFSRSRLRFAPLPTQASYSMTGNVLRVHDEQERVLGSEAVKPGDDIEHVARRFLREKHEKHLRFYDPISYRGNVH